MKNLDAGVDEYIDKAEDSAKPVLNHWRKLVHKVCPEWKRRSSGVYLILIIKVG